MQFYRYEGALTEAFPEEQWGKRRYQREQSLEIAKKSRVYNKSHPGSFYFVENIDCGSVVSAYVICGEKPEDRERMEGFLQKVGLEAANGVFVEVTFREISNAVERAGRAQLLSEEPEDILEAFGLEALTDNYHDSVEYGENILEDADKPQLYREAEQFCAEETLFPELERVFAGAVEKRVFGHPVHYFLETDDREIRKGIYRTLLKSLYAVGRLRNRRYCYFDCRPGVVYSARQLEALYRSCEGGAVAVRYLAADREGDNLASCGQETIEQLCEMMKRYRNTVLTVFCFPRECSAVRTAFCEELETVSFVELREDMLTGQRAVSFLKTLAKADGVRPDKALTEKLEPEKNYLAPELRKLYGEWFNRKLKTKYYPQYRDVATAKNEVRTSAPKGSAYEELEALVGLEEAKKVINRALNFAKAQKVFAEKGLKQSGVSRHMVFTGNPGTAKTTVARLYARIMKENGVLSRGTLVEVGRGDLVGKYVGWTAPTVQKKFKEAEGGVLFIDEAYSLVEERSGMYGDEAINTIVQEMENHRDDVVVIFAGYPEQMEEFLRKNPGLRSRIAFHVPFADYDTEELCGISRLIAKQNGLTLTEGALEKLKRVYDIARTQEDFGNGRYARNVIEKARLAQANRLVAMDYENVFPEDVALLLPEDIELREEVKAAETRRIGFGA